MNTIIILCQLYIIEFNQNFFDLDKHKLYVPPNIDNKSEKIFKYSILVYYHDIFVIIGLYIKLKLAPIKWLNY